MRTNHEIWIDCYRVWLVGMKPLSERDENQKIKRDGCYPVPGVGMKPLSERDENDLGYHFLL